MKRRSRVLGISQLDTKITGFLTLLVGSTYYWPPVTERFPFSTSMALGSLVDYPLTMRLDLVSSGVLKIGYMAVNTNGRRFAICSEFGDSEILEVNIDWGEVYRVCGQKLDGLTSLAFGTDELLATGFEDGTLAIWEITDRGLQNRREGNVRHTDAVCSPGILSKR